MLLQTNGNKLGSDWLFSPAFQRRHHVPADHGQAVEEEESSYTSGLAAAREHWYVCLLIIYVKDNISFDFSEVWRQVDCLMPALPYFVATLPKLAPANVFDYCCCCF